LTLTKRGTGSPLVAASFPARAIVTGANMSSAAIAARIQTIIRPPRRNATRPHAK
jgi:hypothetical protein